MGGANPEVGRRSDRSYSCRAVVEGERLGLNRTDRISRIGEAPRDAWRRATGWRRLRVDREIVVATGLLCAVAVVGLATAGDYGITIDEWNADDYGRKALSWYVSGFTDRAMFKDVQEALWYYGSWFHMLTTVVQSFGIAGHWTVRHAMTFLSGLAGIALLLPMARLAAGRWAGLAAITLCLTTGYLYGSLFFTPIDVPFLFAMTAATLAVMVMAKRTVPSWPATIAAGLLTGLAIATRSSGVITHAYLVGAMALCAFEAALTEAGPLRRPLARVGARTLIAMLIAWLVAFLLWPWLQIGNPFVHFMVAFAYFADHPASWEIRHWGEIVRTNDLPWSYVPAQLAARLPEGFLLLLAAALSIGLANGVGLVREARRALARRGLEGLKAIGLMLTRSRQALIVLAAVLLPLAFIMLEGSTLYNGIRHVLFLIPVLAVIAGYGFARLLPLFGRFPGLMAVGIGTYIGYQVYLLAALHPLEYIEFNALAGGVRGAYHRFDMDYWAASATIALRRLEDRRNIAAADCLGENPPSLMICIPWRENLVGSMYRRPWRLVTDPAKADYIIATDPDMNCAQNQPVVLIDEVKRFGRAFARTYARRPQAAAPSSPPPRP